MNRPFYLQLYLDRSTGQFQLRYSSQENGPYCKLFAINADQADWMKADGWPIVEGSGKNG